MINCILRQAIQNRLFKGKALIIFGPRQVGKSTLVEQILQEKDHLYLNGDDADVQEILTDTTATKLNLAIGQKNHLYR